MTAETRLNPVMSLLAAAVLLSSSFPAAAGARLSCSRAESRLLPVPDSGSARLPLVLPLDKSNSMEALSQGQPVLAEEVLPLDGWRAEGSGQLLQGGELRLLVPVSTGRRAVGQPGDEDYCTFGQVSVSKDLHGRDLRQFNRIAMDILPECRGTGVMNLNLHLGNRTYADVGAHLINLTPNEWNHVELDMSGASPRECPQPAPVTDLKGRNLFLGDSLAYTVRNLRLPRVEHSAKEVGWDVAQGHVAYSMSGYFPGSRKTAVLGFEAARFEVVDTRTGKAVKQGKVRLEHTSIGTFRVADFTSVRRFPTWFSIFNGNEALLLASGKAAAVLGNLLGDRELLDMGCRQLYWSVGENPFCQSLIYGEGHNYPSMDSFSSGELTGEMPVGIRAKGNGDVPYWPQTNNACYKEVWVTSAGKWMSLLAEY